MLFTFFALIPTSIMTSRFGKQHLKRVGGLYLWLHIHWFCGFLGSLATTIASLIIFYQAHFRLLECSRKCGLESFLQRLHALIGLSLYAVMLLLILFSIRVPRVTSRRRAPWNFFHIFLGYFIWIIGNVSCFIGVGLPKSNLNFYGRLPQQLLAAGTCITIACFIVCEWIVHKARFLSTDPDRVERLYNTETRSTNEETEFEEQPSQLPPILIAFNSISGTLIAASIGIMLLNAARISGFKL